MIIKNASVYTDTGFIKQNIHINKTWVTALTSVKGTQQEEDNSHWIDADGLYAIPGLTDLHFHGCTGYDFCDGTEQAIQSMADYEAYHGITSIAPATMTLSDDHLTKIFSCAAKYHSESGADLVGINMEGPYLSLAKKGAQNSAYIRKPDIHHFRHMRALSGNLIKLVSIAPEEDGSLEFIDAVKEEIVISLAHTSADYHMASLAFAHGATHVTHLYNAMLPFTHRDPGVIGAAFDSGNCHVELICDGVHIDPCVVRATFQLFGDDRIILISDSMMATGLADGDYYLGGQAVSVCGNKATLFNGTIAGSVTNLMDCLKKAVSFGISLESAVKCAAVNPAKKLGIYDSYGSITAGKYANIVLLDHNLNIHTVILKGKIIRQ